MTKACFSQKHRLQRDAGLFVRIHHCAILISAVLPSGFDSVEKGTEKRRTFASAGLLARVPNSADFKPLTCIPAAHISAPRVFRVIFAEPLSTWLKKDLLVPRSSARSARDKPASSIAVCT